MNNNGIGWYFSLIVAKFLNDEPIFLNILWNNDKNGLKCHNDEL